MPPFRLAVVCLALTALLAPLAPPATAHPLPHGDTARISNPRPAPGEVVEAGRVEIAALASSDLEITSHRLAVDREERAASSSGGDHATISASLSLEPGWHTVQLWVETAAGETYRSWRFRVTDLRVDRIAGRTRVETAAAISRDARPQPLTAEAAVLARADDFPDALAGAPLAHAEDGPLLLTTGDRLSPEAGDELRRVLAPGMVVYLLGGNSALSDEVQRDVESLGYRAERLAGSTRFATAAEVARRLPAGEAAVVASGEAFADALAASSAAARTGRPILLTAHDLLPAETRDALAERDTTTVTVVGGPNAVSDEVVEALAEQIGQDGVDRLAGRTRFDTAVAVAQRFFADADAVTVASGERFPDALAGGPHAAALGAPVLLTASGSVPGAAADHVAATRPERAVVYGGEAAVGGAVPGGLRGAHVSEGGPVLVGARPWTARVESLEEVVLGFDRDLDVEASSVHVTVNGHEVAATLGTGDFPSTLVLTVDELPAGLEHEVTYPVRVVAAATAGEDTRHIERRFELRKPPRALGVGDRGPEVTDLQRRLQANRFWVGRIDGEYGTLTSQAVMALQKVHGLPVDGSYDQRTRAILETSPAPPQPRSSTGFFYEVDLQRRVLLVVSDGQVAWILNTSAGHGEVYTFQGRTYRANTTTGRHRVTRQIDGLREAERGRLWRPKYYDTNRGIAIHGSTSVPAHHASSGCIRVTYAAMDFLWSIDPHVGANVWVYPEGYYG